VKNVRFAAVTFAALLVSGCAGYGYPYHDMTPLDAATQIVKTASPASTITREKADPIVSAMVFNADQRKQISAELRKYCEWNNGIVINFSGPMPGFGCLSRNTAAETFLANESAQVAVLERHTEDLPSFNAIAELWGYESPNMARERAIREKDRQMVAELERRKRESYKVKIPGSQVCQDQGQVRYVGTVERVEGERVKVFVERAFLLNAPGLSPGGFQQQYSWVNVWDVYACS
jgi:hypothetical protein